MGKIGILLLTTLVSSLTWAAESAFDIKLELSIGGQKISSPRIITKDGETATVVQENIKQKHFIELVATEQTTSKGQPAVLMNFIIGKELVDGSRTVIASPRILTKLNETAQVTVGESNDSESVSISVVAARTNL
jgi:hypothetical protein